jgi:hypothetical protein
MILVAFALFAPWSEWPLSKPLRYTPYPTNRVFRVGDGDYVSDGKGGKIKLPDNWARM